MAVETYRLLHVIGALALCLGVGGMLAAGERRAPAAAALHGTGLLLLLVAGIGALHKGGLGMPIWAIAKIGCWLLLALLPVLSKRQLLSRGAAWLAAVGVVALAAWLGMMKAI